MLNGVVHGLSCVVLLVVARRSLSIAGSLCVVVVVSCC